MSQIEKMEVLANMSIPNLDIVEERRLRTKYHGQVLITIPELAKILDLGNARIRQIVTMEHAPPPVYYGEHTKHGKLKSLYDKREVLIFFIKNCKKVYKRNLYLRNLIVGGHLDATDIQM